MYIDDEDDFDLEDEAETKADESEKSKTGENKEEKKFGLFGKKHKKSKLAKFIKIMAMIVIIFLASWWTAYSKTRAAHKKDNMMAEEMEKMYSDGDYAALSEYYFLRMDDLTDKKYAKYKRMAELYDEYQTADTYIRDAYSKVVQGDNEQVDYSWETEQLFRVILLCDEFREEGYPYDEEQGVTDIRNKVVNYLQGVLLMDRLTIEKVAAQYLGAKDSASIKEVIGLIDGLAANSMNKVLE